VNSLEWEIICKQDTRQDTFRLKVIGGWLVRHRDWLGDEPTQSMVFIEDKDHFWLGDISSDYQETIDELLDGRTGSRGVAARACTALRCAGITHTYMLKGMSVRDLSITPNLGAKCVALVIFSASRYGVKIPFNGHPFPIIKRYLAELNGE